MSNPTPLVPGCDEQLLDHDRLDVLVVQGDVAGRLALVAGDERHVAPQHLEHALVAPAGKVDERGLR
jgi:hypothetical protein